MYMIETSIIITIIVCSSVSFLGTLLFKSKCTSVDIGRGLIHSERNVQQELKTTENINIELPKI